MADAAVIFDVDGVLLELTSAEKDAFFVPFEIRYGLKNLSRDWNSYAIRNDENIIAEILASHGIPARERSEVVADYLEILKLRLPIGVIEAITIPGAHKLLNNLHGNSRIGIATANLLGAAELRLKHVNLWPYVFAYAFGAEGGGHKREILARAVASINLPKNRIVYIDHDDFGLNQSKFINVIEINNLEHDAPKSINFGASCSSDNLNDVEAGLSNGVHFIGFSANLRRLNELKRAGASHLSNYHLDTFRLISHLLGK